MTIHIPRAIVLYLLWLGFISAALLCATGNVLPFGLGFISPEDAFTCLIEAELFFVLVIWPFFIPGLLVRKVSIPSGVSGHAHLLVLQVCVLFVVALPVAFLCQNLADVGARVFFSGHLLVATAACFVAALFGVGAERKNRVAPWYFLGFFVASAFVPFVHYVAVEFAGQSLRFLAAVSPFWGAAELDGGAPLVGSTLFALAALGLFAAAPFWGRPSAG
ncbi:MAG: hypothetical protein HYY16_09985 [Planctomycetes bacterium]|nr:hypothetical protein [Planctomycetota bacterium]